MSKRVVFTKGNQLHVITKGKSSNQKISNGKPLVQTYCFDIKQYELANCGEKISMHDFFSLDVSNCLDCPFSYNSGNGKCYTHKFNQYMGFLALLRAIGKSEISGISSKKIKRAVEFSKGSYVRFGTYGEPSLLSFNIVKQMVEASSVWTGYTHQNNKKWASKFKDYFMASVHSQGEADNMQGKGWRSFIALDKDSSASGVQCPASAESGKKSNCAACGLCSGAMGKGNKDIKINVH